MGGKLVLSAVVATVALSTALAAPANADPETDANYIAALDKQGIKYPSVADAISLAQAVCEAMAGGSSLTDATTQVSSLTDLGLEDSGFLVGAATASYCPAYSP